MDSALNEDVKLLLLR
jgi:hypothetical protein